MLVGSFLGGFKMFQRPSRFMQLTSGCRETCRNPPYLAGTIHGFHWIFSHLNPSEPIWSLSAEHHGGLLSGSTQWLEFRTAAGCPKGYGMLWVKNRSYELYEPTKKKFSFPVCVWNPLLILQGAVTEFVGSLPRRCPHSLVMHWETSWCVPANELDKLFSSGCFRWSIRFVNPFGSNLLPFRFTVQADSLGTTQAMAISTFYSFTSE